jgi:lipopolysaccharide transport system ATP-binding protein
MESERALESIRRQLVTLEIGAAELGDSSAAPGHVRIRARGLSKQYHRALTTAIFPIPIRRKAVSTPMPDWALTDVSFTIVESSMVGLIGSHGAGKSTLLRILSRITPPTLGRAELRGRVIPLLTMRGGVMVADETPLGNARMVARFYGVPAAVASRNIDAILAEAGLESRPGIKLKHCSSGTLKRLGIATILNLEPDVLLMDDVFPGALTFQDDVVRSVQAMATRRGVTALMATDNLDVVRAYCDRVLWLERGRLVADGPAALVLDQYLRASTRRLANRGSRQRLRNQARRRDLRAQARADG